jgi:hypothetical protein
MPLPLKRLLPFICSAAVQLCVLGGTRPAVAAQVAVTCPAAQPGCAITIDGAAYATFYFLNPLTSFDQGPAGLNAALLSTETTFPAHVGRPTFFVHSNYPEYVAGRTFTLLPPDANTVVRPSGGDGLYGIDYTFMAIAGDGYAPFATCTSTYAYHDGQEHDLHTLAPATMAADGPHHIIAAVDASPYADAISLLDAQWQEGDRSTAKTSIAVAVAPRDNTLLSLSFVAPPHLSDFSTEALAILAVLAAAR